MAIKNVVEKAKKIARDGARKITRKEEGRAGPAKRARPEEGRERATKRTRPEEGRERATKRTRPEEGRERATKGTRPEGGRGGPAKRERPAQAKPAQPKVVKRVVEKKAAVKKVRPVRTPHEMFTVARREIDFAGRKLVLETGRVARQATGSVLVTYGETTVLCTVVAVPKADPKASFFPLSVHYQEKAFSIGKIPGGFFKREAKPSEKEVLTSRLIDRPLRPLFPNGFFHEVQVVCTVLSYDRDAEPDVAAMIGASAALSLSGAPFLGPIAGVRVGYKNDDYILNPSLADLEESAMDLMVAGTREGVLMVESEISELEDEIVLEGVIFGHKAMQPVIEMIEDLQKEAGKPAWAPQSSEAFDTLKAKLLDGYRDRIETAFAIEGKGGRLEALDKIAEEASDALAADLEGEGADMLFARAFKAAKEDVLRAGVLAKKRIDGRGLKDVRVISCETDALPLVHGSALFTRGETQACVVATLGSNDDAQIMDTLEGEYKEAFMLHYNFPSYSVGEARRVGPPGRREIGHGKLAWRAVRPVLPGADRFPYTLRVVSEITESNGSSSMATVCGTSLALMDAGVPLRRPVAGIAMGLVKEGKDYAVLSDISGDEDSLGDMDFKVAGTEKGLTALQMDIKITSITPKIMKDALAQAHEGRMHILSEMMKELKKHRELSDTAPRVQEMKISRDKIKDVIGPGGKVIRELCEVSASKIDVEDDGTLRVFSPNADMLDIAVQRIKEITYEPQAGDILDGEVVNIQDFGAFVNFKGQDGLVHISELADERVAKVTDVVKMGDKVRVKVIGFDRGKVKLSIKQVPQA